MFLKKLNYNNTRIQISYIQILIELEVTVQTNIFWKGELLFSVLLKLSTYDKILVKGFGIQMMFTEIETHGPTHLFVYSPNLT